MQSDEVGVSARPGTPDLPALLGDVASILLPVIVITVIGYAWARRDPGFRARFIGDLALHIGVPALLFGKLVTTQVDEALLLTSALAAAAFTVATLAALRAMVVVTGGTAEPRVTGLTFANWGNLGIPLCLFAFGQLGLTLATTFFAVSIFLQFTLGWRIASGSWPWRRIATLPVLWALGAAVGVKLLDAQPPGWVMNLSELAGGLAIPAMLLSLGGGLARMNPASLGPGFVYAIVRLLLGLALGYGCLAVFDFPPEAGPVVLLISIMPLAAFNYVLSEKVGGDSETVAGYIMMSTLLSCITLPIALLVLI